MKARILVGSVETDFVLLFSHILEAAGYLTSLAKTVEEVKRFTNDRDVKAILLDGHLDHFPAAQACQAIKQNPMSRWKPAIAIIRSEAQSRHLDLISAGVDETFVRPFAPAKLLEYLHRRLSQHSDPYRGGGRFEHSGVIMDLDDRRVTRDGAAIHLAPTEFALLLCLMRRPNKICSRAELVEAGWPGRRFVEAPTLNVHIGRLRKALMEGVRPDLIRTVRSIGYVFGTPPNGASTVGAQPAKEA